MENCRSLCPGNTPPKIYQICGGATSYEAIYGLNATLPSPSSTIQVPAATGTPVVFPGNSYYTYAGCYSDRLGAPYILTGSVSNQPTVESCLSWCQFGGYQYAAVKTMPSSNGAAPIAAGGTDYSGTTCLCGNSIRNSTGFSYTTTLGGTSAVSSAVSRVTTIGGSVVSSSTGTAKSSSTGRTSTIKVSTASVVTSSTIAPVQPVVVAAPPYASPAAGCLSPCVGNPNEICGGYSGPDSSPQAAYVNLYSLSQNLTSTSLTCKSILYMHIYNFINKIEANTTQQLTHLRVLWRALEL